ncbi:hypothetical protein ACGFIV_27835 [Sphaerisporangium sp. NPDC049003]|uniref:hypothetical protein n=1 Tax=Sphaerisporangium sp. NPDC049003 TaxID=3364517 RepID=UPI003714F324
MAGKRSVILVAPAVLALALGPTGASQASVVARSVAGEPAASGTAPGVPVPRDRGDYAKGFGEGYAAGRAECDGRPKPKTRGRGLPASPDYERGYATGYDEGYTSCEKAAGETPRKEPPGLHTPVTPPEPPDLREAPPPPESPGLREPPPPESPGLREPPPAPESPGLRTPPPNRPAQGGPPLSHAAVHR